MQTVTELALRKAVRGVFTRQEVACWIGNDGARLDGLLKRAVAAKEVYRIRRGLFCLAHPYLQRPIQTFELAQRIHGPSYISLESALAHHGWIPEAVYTVASASLERSRTCTTPVGLFSFTRIPQRDFFSGVTRISLDDGGSFFVASPLKALADYVYAHARDWCSVEPVIESLRVDEAELNTLPADAFEQLTPVYTSDRVRRFLDGMRRDLQR